MWRFKDFTFHKGNINHFTIFGYTQATGYDWCKVVAYCQSEAGVRWASSALYNLSTKSLSEKKLDHDFTVQSRVCRKAGPNHNKHEVAAILNLSPEAALAALIEVGSPPEAETVVLKPGALSVAPCAHRAHDNDFGPGQTYVRVRFNGFSIPFYFNKEDWIPDITLKAVTKQVGGANAEAAYKVLVDNSKMLHKRALERSLNLSEIDDYAQHNLAIMKKGEHGHYYTASQAEMADPNSELASVFSYGYSKCFAMIKDQIYTVKGFISGYNLYYGRTGDDALQSGVWNLDYSWGDKTYRGYMRLKDCVPLDPEDGYVREKIERSMKAKL